LSWVQRWSFLIFFPQRRLDRLLPPPPPLPAGRNAGNARGSSPFLPLSASAERNQAPPVYLSKTTQYRSLPPAPLQSKSRGSGLLSPLSSVLFSARAAALFFFSPASIRIGMQVRLSIKTLLLKEILSEYLFFFVREKRPPFGEDNGINRMARFFFLPAEEGVSFPLQTAPSGFRQRVFLMAWEKLSPFPFTAGGFASLRNVWFVCSFFYLRVLGFLPLRRGGPLFFSEEAVGVDFPSLCAEGASSSRWGGTSVLAPFFFLESERPSLSVHTES